MSHPCLADQTLAAFVDGLLPEADRAEVMRHLDGCAACLDRVAALARLADAPVAQVPAALVEITTRRQTAIGRLVPYGAVAACLLLAVGLWPSQKPAAPSQSAPRATFDASADMRASASQARLVVDTPRDNERVAPGFEVTWHGPSGAVFFEIQLTTVDGDLLWTTNVEGAGRRVTVPTVLSSSQPSYLWVTAHFPEGRRLVSNVIRVQGRVSD